MFQIGDRVIAPCPGKPYKREGTIVNFGHTIPVSDTADLAMIWFDADETGFRARWSCKLSSLEKIET